MTGDDDEFGISLDDGDDDKKRGAKGGAKGSRDDRNLKRSRKVRSCFPNYAKNYRILLYTSGKESGSPRNISS